MVIQWSASHFFAGNLKGANVLPASSTITSPQAADCKASSTLLLSETLISLPWDGVDASAVFTHRVGRLAGPSLVAPKAGASPDLQYRLSGCAMAPVAAASSTSNTSVFTILAGPSERDSIGMQLF